MNSEIRVGPLVSFPIEEGREKMAEDSSDPWKVFTVAWKFSRTAELILARFRTHKEDLIHSLAVNSAFAVELYFKCLRILERKPNKKSHELKWLFDHLEPGHQAAIKGYYDAAIKGDPYAKRVEAAVPHMKHDVDTVLTAMDTAFEDWRYQFEKTKTLTYFGFEHLRRAVERLILDIQPAWRPSLPAE
jgi:hypothetical protein